MQHSTDRPLKSDSSRQNTSDSTVPTSTTSTGFATTTGGLFINYTVASPTSVSIVPVDCPKLDGQVYTTKQDQTYAISCTRDEHAGDIVVILAYTYADCIEACSTANHWAEKNNNTACVAVQFDGRMANVSTSSSSRFGNCWLKGASAGTLDHTLGALSARLVGS